MILRMNMIEVKEVKTRKEIKEFVEFPLNLYKGNDCFVPPLYADEMAMFKPTYHYYEQAEAVFYNAYRNGKMVGRIQGILQKASNEKWEQKRVRFTRFDSVDDQEVANALFTAVENWGREKGMEEIVGPLGFSDQEREGLLIEGFDEVATFEEQYNYDYYQRLIENCGYGKDVDWVEHQLKLKQEEDGRLEKFAELILKRFNLRLVQEKTTRAFVKKYADEFFAIIDETYDKLYGTVPFTEGMKKMMIENFNLIIKPKYVSVIVDQNDKVVCAGLCFPSLSKAIQKSKGHLTIPALFRLLHDLNHPKVLDLALIGVVKEYEMKGVATIFLARLKQLLRKEKIEYCETNLNLENNHHVINLWNNFETRRHKRRRCFIKKITD